MKPAIIDADGFSALALDARADESRRRRWNWPLAVFGAVLVLYIGSACRALWRLEESVARRDVGAVAAAIDWDGVRQGFAGQIEQAMGADPNAANGDDLPPFGSSFASGMAHHAADGEVTPARLAALLERGSTRAGGTGWSFLSAGFDGPSAFHIILQPIGEGTVTLAFRFEHWRWKLVRVAVPDSWLAGPETAKL